MPIPNVYTATEDPTSQVGNNGDIYFHTGLIGLSAINVYKKVNRQWGLVGTISTGTDLGMRYSEVTLNNNQILAFGASQGPPIDHNAFIPIVPATWLSASGGLPPEMFVLTSVSMFLNQTVDGAYDSDHTVAFCYGGDGGSQITKAVSLALDQGAPSFVYAWLPITTPRIDGIGSLIDNGIWLENLDLTGSFSGGNASNTLKIRIYYNRVPL